MNTVNCVELRICKLMEPGALWMIPCVGLQGFLLPGEVEGCGPLGGFAVCLAGDYEAWIGDERTGYISCAVALGRLLGEGSVHG